MHPVLYYISSSNRCTSVYLFYSIVIKLDGIEAYVVTKTKNKQFGYERMASWFLSQVSTTTLIHSELQRVGKTRLHLDFWL